MAGDLAFAACTPSTIKVRATYKRPAALTTPRVHDLPEDVDVAPGTEDGGFAGAPERAMMQGAPAGAIAAPKSASRVRRTRRPRSTPWSTRLRRAHLPADLPENVPLGCGSSWGTFQYFLTLETFFLETHLVTFQISLRYPSMIIWEILCLSNDLCTMSI